MDAVSFGSLDSYFIARIRMAYDTQTRVSRQHTLKPLGGFCSAVRDDHLPSMLAEPNPHPAAVME